MGEWRAWNGRELRYLRRHYQKRDAAAIGAALGRTARAVRHQASKKGILYERPWTPAEDARLLAIDLETSLEMLAAELGRTRASVAGRAARVRVKRRNPKPWSAEEDGFLEANRKKMVRRELAAALGRTDAQVKKRLAQLGIAVRPVLSREARGLLWGLREMPGVIEHFAERFGLPAELVDRRLQRMRRARREQGLPT